MNMLYRIILEKRELNKKMLAVLLDPDQCKGSLLAATIAELKTATPDFVFVGGSHAVNSVNSIIEILKEETDCPVILFPGDASQFSIKADALLYLSLLSGRNAEFLIGQHINSSVSIKKSMMEVIPTGYLLIEGNKTSSVEYISNTRPIPRDKKDIALSTAVAGELLGMRLIYLEAGSGAKQTVPLEMIKYLSTELSIPLMVGGGIGTEEQLTDAFRAGADIIVVGNAFESNPRRITEFVNATRKYQ
jgi:putative glycerol-1-phosphate prenyltransferase